MEFTSLAKSGAITLIILLATLLGMSVSSTAAEKVRKFEIPLGQFNKLSVDDNVNVVYRCVADSTGMAVYRGADRFEDAFIFTNSKGHLRVQVNTDDVNDPDLPTVYLYSDYLTCVKNGSERNVLVEKPAPTPKFEVVQIGNGSVYVENIVATNVVARLSTGMGNIVVSGKCETAKFVIIGTGTIQADRLFTDTTNCKIIGGGTIGCWPDKKLNVFGIGSTKIYYKGNPAISKKGGGHVLPIAED